MFMNRFRIASLALFAFILATVAPSAMAAPVIAAPVRVVYSSTHVSVSAWTPIVTSLARSIKGMFVMNSAPVPIKLAVGASGGEVPQVILPALMSTGVYVPMPVSQAQRLSIEALDSQANAGELDASFIYN